MAGNTYYVDSAYGGGGLGDLGSATNPFTTIQDAIDAAAVTDGDTIHVAAGVYAEALNVHKSVTLLGANAGLDGTDPARGPETIITSVPGADITVTLSADDVTVDGFAVINNHGWCAIGNDGAVDGASIVNNVVQSTPDDAYDIMLYNFDNPVTYSYGGPSTFGTISGNAVSGGDIGILIYNNSYASVTDNTVTEVNVGIQTGNMSKAAPVGTTPEISHNDIASHLVGIYHNLSYGTASPFTIDDNDVTGLSGAMLSASGTGIRVMSISSPGGAVVTDNDVSGFDTGIQLWNDEAVVIHGGTVSGNDVGIAAIDDHPTFGQSNEAGDYGIDGVNLTDNGLDLRVQDTELSIDDTGTPSTVLTVQVQGAGLFDEGAFAGPLSVGSDLVAVAGNQVMTGGDGLDTIDMVNADASGAFVDLEAGLAFSSPTGIDSLESIENARGSVGNDGLYGDNNDNVFFATDGADVIDGRGDGDGGDTYDASAATGTVNVDLAAGSVTGAFTASLANIENVNTGSGADAITLSSAANAVDGGTGFDVAYVDLAYTDGAVGYDSGAGAFTSVGGDRLANVEKLVFTNGTDAPIDDTNVWLVHDSGELTAALTGAVDGDIIKLASGTYVGNFTISDAVTIESATGDPADVVFSGNFRSLNGLLPGDSVADFLKTQYEGAAAATGNGLEIGHGGVTLKNITITEYSVGIALATDAIGVTIEGVEFASNLNAIRKSEMANVTDFNWIGGSVEDGWGGMTVYADETGAGGGTFDNVTIDGVNFENLNYKGLYFEQLSNAEITNIEMNNVGQWGGWSNGKFGAGIDINLKYEAYTNIGIHGFEFHDVGLSSHGNVSGDSTGAAIVVKARDDGSYAAPAATLDGVHISNGTIDGTSTGIRIGEPTKANAGPTGVTVSDVAITGAEHSYDNQSLAALTVNLLDGGDTVTTNAASIGPITYNGSDGADDMSGSGAAESFAGGEGNDAIDGGTGAGVDVVTYTGAYGDAEFGYAGGAFTIKTSATDTDTVANVEKAVFGGTTTVWLVDSDGDLADALAGAASGDVILLAPGTYSADITLESGVDIVGLDGAVLQGAIIAPADLENVTVRGLDVANDGMLLDMRATDSVTDVVFQDMTFSLTGAFSAGGPNAQMPFGNGQVAGSMTINDNDGDDAGLSFVGVTLQSNDNDSGLLALAYFATQSVGGAKVVLDDVSLTGMSAGNVGSQWNMSGDPAGAAVEIVNSDTSGGGNFYISGYDSVLVDGNDFVGQGIAINGVKHAVVTNNDFSDIDGTITANGTQHRGLTIEDAWGTDGVSDLTITGNTFTDISVSDGAIAFQRFTDGGATIDNVSDVTIEGNSFDNVAVPVYLDTTSFGPGAVLPADFDGDHFVLATAGADDLIGTSGNDIVFADAGNDTITGGDGNDSLDGGDGVDTVNYSGNVAAEHVVYSAAEGTWTVSSDDGSDTVSNAEIVDDASGGRTLLVGGGGFASLQDAIDAAQDGDTILVAPGTYNELTTYNGGSQIGLVIDKSVTIQGVDEDGAFITDAADVAAHVVSGAQSNWGTNFFVTADGVTIIGLDFVAADGGAPYNQSPGEVNKAIEVVGNDFTLQHSRVGAADGIEVASTIYINDQVASGDPGFVSHIDAYEVSDNILEGTFVVTNGPGTGHATTDFVVTDNQFVNNVGADEGYNWGILVNGQQASVAWRPAHASMPDELSGNSFTDDYSILFRGAEDDAGLLPTAEQVSDFLDDNTFASWAYVTDANGDLDLDLDVDGVNHRVFVESSLQDAISNHADAGDTVNFKAPAGGTSATVDVENLTFSQAAGGATSLTLDTGIAQVTLAGSYGMSVTGSSDDNIVMGNDGNNSLTGASGNDTIDGGYGSDTIDGGANDDDLDGNVGNDTILGGTGNDTVTGGDGSDSIDAGDGVDTVVFEHDINEYIVQRTGGTYDISRNGVHDIVTGAEFFTFDGQTVDVQGINADAIVNRFAPVFSPDSPAETIAVAENVDDALVYDANATDGDSSTVFGEIVYSLEGTDAAAFTINDSTGEVRLVDPADREVKASYAVTVRATQGTTSATKNLTVNVTDANDTAPVFSSGSTAEVTEGSSVTTVVYDAAATDADTSGGAIAYSLDGADAAAFTIDAVTGQVRLDAVADFETKASYEFSVVATQGATSASQAVTLSVLNVNEGLAGVLGTVNKQVEAGSTLAPLGTLADTDDGVTFEVQAVDDGGGAIFNGNTELAVGHTLTLDEVNSLTFTSVGDGSITFLATDGGDSEPLQVNLDVTPGVSTTYNGTNGANYLDGADGNDSVNGRKGNDVLLGGAGKDLIDGGSGHDTIFGGSGRDAINGSWGDDVIYGGGSRDILKGGAGADKFVFDTALSPRVADVIRDFQHGTDKIALDADIFGSVGPTLDNWEFRINRTGNAQDVSDKIIYETDTGRLYYDADGRGAGAKVLIVTLDPHSNLSYHDFEIV